MEEEITLEEYIENYNTAIYNLYPKFFDYLNYINMSANNINWMGEQLFKDYIQIEDLYAYFNIDSLINSNSALAKLSDDIYEDVSELLNNDRIVYHKKIGETWS
ncbi:MAG: hypothetical protein V8Q75_01050 [Bacilli bacterium]